MRSAARATVYAPLAAEAARHAHRLDAYNTVFGVENRAA
jgi:hypothetical protein